MPMILAATHNIKTQWHQPVTDCNYFRYKSLCENVIDGLMFDVRQFWELNPCFIIIIYAYVMWILV